MREIRKKLEKTERLKIEREKKRLKKNKLGKM